MMTYVILVATLVSIAIALDLLIGQRLVTQKRFYVVLAIFSIFMLLFYSIPTRLPIIFYNQQKTLPFRIGSIPIEDFFYSIAFILVALNAQAILTMSRTFYKKMLISSRPFSWVNTGFGAIAGIIYAKGHLAWPDLLLIFYFLFPYNLFLYGINDVFDYATDKRNPRKNSIQGGLLEPQFHKPMIFIVCAINVPFAVLILCARPFMSLIFGITLFTVYAYSTPPFRFKRIPILDAFNSSLHFVLPVVCGVFWVNSTHVPYTLLLAYLLWGMGSQILGAIPDITCDRQAHESTIATVMGQRITGSVSAVLYTLTCVILYLYLSHFIALLFIPYIGLSVWASQTQPPERAAKQFRYFMYYNLLAGAILTMTYLFLHR